MYVPDEWLPHCLRIQFLGGSAQNPAYRPAGDLFFYLKAIIWNALF
jgi:hypothetical protein